MATLFNTKISVTYPGLLKTIDNAALSATLKELTDGSGNQSGLYLNTAGDFKVTSILEWGSLKDTGTGVTITQFVTQANGIANFDNDTTIPTSAAVKDYVDTKFSQTDTLAEVLGFGNTTSGTDIAVSANDDITFTDSSKILMGAGSDLQIYHDGNNSLIKDTGTGVLYIGTDAFRITSANLSENMISAFEDGAVNLYYNNSLKIATTNTGVDVTGNLVVSGTITGSGGSFLPLAGGTMTGNIVLNDNVKSIYGTSSDGLEIYHDGSNSYINESGTGSLYIKSAGAIRLQSQTGENMIYAVNDSAVNLYFNNSNKFQTTSTGANVSGDLTVTGSITGSGGSFLPLAGGTMTGNTIHNDNVKSIYGTSSDGLEIFHNSSNSFIKDSGTGLLVISTNQLQVYNAGISEFMITAVEDGAVNLYYDGSKKFETTTDGITITGGVSATIESFFYGGLLVTDSQKIKVGTSADLQIYHDGSNSYIQDTSGTGDLIIDTNAFRLRSANGGESMITAFEDSAVNIMYNAFTKLSTTNTGISVTGNAALSAGFSIPDNQYGKFGTGDDIIIGHDSTNSIIRSSTGDLFIDQSAVTKSIFFRVSNANALDTTALTINREGDLTTGADVTIAGNLTVNGTTTTINTQTLAVEDPLIELSKDNGANSVDIGFYGKYNDGTARYLGLFSDASDSNKFRLFKGTTVQPTTTVNIAGAGYVAADLQVAGLEATSFTNTGDLFVEDNIYLTDATTTRAKIQLNSSDRDNLDIKAVSLGSTMNFFTVDTLALTLDASQNAQFANAVLLADNKKLEFGGSGDLKIYHSAGSDSYIQATTGDLIIQNTTDNKDIIFQSDNGSGGVATYLTVDGANEVVSFQKDSKHEDNVKANFGNAADLQIYHNDNSGNNNIDNINGDLYINQYADDGDILFRNDDGSGGIAQYFRVDGGAVETRFLKSTRHFDNVGAYFGDSADLQIYHDGSNSYIKDTGTGNLYIRATNFALQSAAGTDDYITTTENAEINLFYNNSKKFETTSTGVSVTGNIGTSGSVLFDDNQGINFGNSNAKINGSSSDGIKFFGTGSEKMRLTQAGNLGIGTDNPGTLHGAAYGTTKLQIDGGTDRGQMIIEGDTDASIVLSDNGATANERVFATNVGGGKYTIKPLNDNGTSTAGGVAVTILHNGKVGIGEDSPDFLVDAKKGYSSGDGKVAKFRAGNDATFVQFDTVQVVQQDVPCLAIIETSTGTQSDEQKLTFSAGDTRAIIGSSTTVTDGMSFYVNRAVTAHGYAVTGTKALHLQNNGNATFAGNVGIGVGTITPSSSLTIQNNAGGTNTRLIQLFHNNVSANGYVTIGAQYTNTNRYVESEIRFGSETLNGACSYLGFVTGCRNDGANTEKLRITSGGDVLIGGSAIQAVGAVTFDKSAVGFTITNNTTSSAGNGHEFQVFRYNSTQIGSIVMNGTTATQYATSSDYRLKEDLQDFAGLDMVSKIPVYDFKWKTDESRSYGVMAHELQEVLPQAVVGEKDAEEMQSVDYSKIVPLLVKSIQELKAEVDLLKQECKCKN